MDMQEPARWRLGHVFIERGDAEGRPEPLRWRFVALDVNTERVDFMTMTTIFRLVVEFEGS